MSEVWANLMLGIHALVGVAVFGGLVLALAGALLRWRWTGRGWWRVPHLILTWYLCVRAHCHWPCPLSLWEDGLRGASLSHAASPMLRWLSFRELDAASFLWGITSFTAFTTVLFVAQRIGCTRL